MDRFLGWPLIMWTLRIGILIVVIGGQWIFGLLVLRFFRWKTMRAMVLADPPQVESVGSEFAGAKAELKLHQQKGEPATTLEQRVTELEAKLKQVLEKNPRSEPTEATDEREGADAGG